MKLLQVSWKLQCRHGGEVDYQDSSLVTRLSEMISWKLPSGVMELCGELSVP